MENKKIDRTEVDALCRECGHAFKIFVDRVLFTEGQTDDKPTVSCPVCGCSECKIGK
jgi:hypothetical protein